MKNEKDLKEVKPEPTQTRAQAVIHGPLLKAFKKEANEGYLKEAEIVREALATRYNLNKKK